MTNNVDKVADNAWLKAVERIAIPFIGLLLWQQWQSLREIERNLPSFEVRVAQIEKQQADAALAIATGRTSDMSFQQDIIVKLATLTALHQRTSADTEELKQALKELNSTLNGKSKSFEKAPP